MTRFPAPSSARFPFRRRRPLTALAGLCAVLVLAGGCTQKDPAASGGDVTSIDAASETSTTLQGSNLSGADVSPVLGAGNDLTRAACAPDAQGKWEFTGTLTNSSSEVSTYRITVEVARRSTSVVLGQRSMFFDLQPKETRRVDITGIATADAAHRDVICAHLVTVQRRGS